MKNNIERNWIIVVFILFFLINLNQLARASESTDKNKSIAEKNKQYTVNKADAAIKSIERHEKLEDELLEYRIFEMEHRISSFWAQYWKSWVIFFCVMLLVLGGFYLAYQQFVLDKESGNSTESTIELSSSGLKMRSSVIGLIILAMSFAFFYLYVKEVYKITETSQVTQEHNISNSTDSKSRAAD